MNMLSPWKQYLLVARVLGTSFRDKIRFPSRISIELVNFHNWHKYMLRQEFNIHFQTKINVVRTFS